MAIETRNDGGGERAGDIEAWMSALFCKIWEDTYLAISLLLDERTPSVDDSAAQIEPDGGAEIASRVSNTDLRHIGEHVEPRLPWER